MELYLQLGHGMQALSLELIKSWGKGHVILSPVNMRQDKIEPFSRKIQANGGDVLFDPQMFYPKDGHSKLQAYDYWPDANSSITTNNIHSIKRNFIHKINKSIINIFLIFIMIYMVIINICNNVNDRKKI